MFLCHEKMHSQAVTHDSMLVTSVSVQARKRRVICALVIVLVVFVAFIEAFSQEGRRSKCKHKRGEIPFYKCIIYLNETDCHDNI